MEEVESRIFHGAGLRAVAGEANMNGRMSPAAAAGVAGVAARRNSRLAIEAQFSLVFTLVPSQTL